MEIPSDLNLRKDVPLGDCTTWKAGGAADLSAVPDRRGPVEALVHWGRGEQLPMRFIGAGSNLLISDEGLAGLVICSRRLQGSQLEPTTGIIEAQAGEPLPTLARRAAKAGLSGLEWSVGIPGTVGGAVVMNAGAQGGCIAESLIDATVLDPNSGQTRRVSCNELDYDYRHSALQSKALAVLSARFRLKAGGDPIELSPFDI